MRASAGALSSRLNLALDVYPSFATGTWSMDLILCRNVLIYFDRETVHHVARRFHNALAEGGWLLTASSDPPLWDMRLSKSSPRRKGCFTAAPSTHLSRLRTRIVGA